METILRVCPCVLLSELNDRGIVASCEIDLCNRGVKAQMKHADRIMAKHTIVIGSTELENGEANIKIMKTGENVPVKLDAESIAKVVK